ncbi:MAG TPA: FAD-dependent monooxygenase, partial [Galbitalea sp.]
MLIGDAAIIGGGPAGLFAAILLRRAYPGARVTVYERSVPDETFGFGIAFTRTTLDMIARADEESFEQLKVASVEVPPQEMRIGSESAWSHGNVGALGIARATLLKVLTERAIALGANVRFGEATTLEELAGAQLIVAADGVSSSVRGELGDSIGAHVTPGRGVFMWLGCDTQLTSNLFAPVLTDDGLFNVHCYPYASDRSTIGVEASVETWRSAGMDAWTDETAVGDSDSRSIAYLQDVFGDVLGGARLLGNRSRWMHFRTVTVDHWHRANVVLIGDAAHTAHYSVGAGTKMAMDDSVALVEALVAEPSNDLEAALASYEGDRRPRVERLQDLANRSRWWWESLSSRVDLPVAQLMSAYLSRGGGVSSRKLVAFEQDIVRDALSVWSGEEFPPGDLDPESISDFVLSRPLDLGTTVLESRVFDSAKSPLRLARARIDIRDPWSSEADRASSEVAEVSANAEVVILSGPSGRTALLDRLQFAERARLSSSSAIGVQAQLE